MWGNKSNGGIDVGILDFTTDATCPAKILGYFLRHDATSITVVFLKKANNAEPAYPTDSINTSGVTGSTGITKLLDVSDFTTTDISTDDVIVPYITTITGTLTKVMCGLIIQKQ